MQKIVIVAAGLLVVGCTGTVTVDQLEPGHTPAFNPDTEGVLLSSSSFFGNYPDDARLPYQSTLQGRCTAYMMNYRKRDEGSERVVGELSAVPKGGDNWTVGDPHDFEVSEGLGYVTATILPAGRYEVYFFSNLCRGTAFYATEYFSVPFEVKPGVATYVGGIRYGHTFYENFAGVTVPGPPVMRFEMKPDRDLPIIRKKYPFIAGLETVTIDLPWQMAF